MSKAHVPGHWEVPATLLIVDPIDDNDQFLTLALVDRIKSEARANISESDVGTFDRLEGTFSTIRELLSEEHLFLVVLAYMPEFKMLMPLALGNFDRVWQERLEYLVSKAVMVASYCKSDGFEVQRFTEHNEDVEKVITSMLQQEMERVNFRSLKAKDKGHGPKVN